MPNFGKGKYHVSPEDKGKRGGAVRKQIHDEKLDKLFKDKTYEVVSHLELDKDKPVITILGHKASNVWLVRCKETGEMHHVGHKTIRIMRTKYKNLEGYVIKKPGRPLGTKNKKTVEDVLKAAKLKDLFE